MFPMPRDADPRYVRNVRLLGAASVTLLVVGILALFTVDDDQGVEAAQDGSTTIAIDGATTVPGPADSTVGPSSTVAATTESTDGGATTSAPGGPVTTVPATTSPSGSKAPSPTTPGTYTYDTTGTASFGNSTEDIAGTSTLTVSAPDGSGRQVHVEDARRDGEGSVTTTTYRLAPEGVYLESLVLESTVATPLGRVDDSRTLTATAPFLLLPAGAGAGTTTTGELAGSGITAKVTFTVESVGATSRTRLHAELSGEVEGTMTSTIDARADRLPVRNESTSDVTARGFNLTSHTVSVLRA